MAIEAIGGISSGNSSATSSTSVINQDEFLKILLTQLTLQDPLKPLDNQEFLAQLAQFTSLEQQKQTTDKLDTLLGVDVTNQAVSLIGKTVDVASASGVATGQVTTVSFSNGQPFLSVQLTNGTFLTGISLSQISTIR
jgi:flagellar basal-body rod modification protein FlgD